MEAIRRSIRFAAGATLLLAFALVAVTLPRGGDVAALPVEAKGGGPFEVPTAPGATEASWRGSPILVFVVPATLLEGVEQLRGPGEATPSTEVPGHPGLRLFAISAKSTHLGCTVALATGLGPALDVSDYDLDGRLDGRVMDQCHQGQWDPYHRGRPVTGPAPERLAVLDVHVVDGMLVATSFDGPTGPAR